MPSVGISLYFYSVVKTSDENNDTINTSTIKSFNAADFKKDLDESPRFSYTRASNLLWHHFVQSYSNPTIIMWSLWWALGMAGFVMVQIYVQLLWQAVRLPLV